MAHPLVAGEPVSIELTADVQFGGRDLEPNREFYRLKSGGAVSLSRLSFLLSDFALMDEAGSWIEFANHFAHFDLEKGNAVTSLRGLPAGSYRAIRMTVGLDSTTDLRNPSEWPADHPLNPVTNGLHWGMADAGFIYFAVEGRHRSDRGETLGISYHLATQRARTSVELPLEFEAGDQFDRLTLQLDLAALFSSAEEVAILTDGTSTHTSEDDPLAVKLIANLPAVFTGVTASDNAARQTALSGDPTPKSVAAEDATPRRIGVTPMFPRLRPPIDNPLTEEGIALGERLFHELRLSGDNSLSCASCHDKARAFTDGEAVSRGISGAIGHRNSMPLFNLAWRPSFFWDGRSGRLRDQIYGPWQSPIEMGGDPVADSAEIAADPSYPPMFKAAFAEADVTPENITLALEQFLFTLVSQDSRFDRIYRGKERFTEVEQRGYSLFHTEYDPRLGKLGADCFHCHGGLLLSDQRFHNNGLPILNVDDRGRSEVTGEPTDEGKFVTPSLRNIALTAPYMHDGRFGTLREVVDHYNTGVVRSPTLDPNLAKHPTTGLELSEDDIDALIAFLETLTDPQFSSQ